MGLLADYGIDVVPRPYHGTVFRIEELAEVVTTHGLPRGGVPASYEGHQREDFEHYIEVQVWSDAAVTLDREQH